MLSVRQTFHIHAIAHLCLVFSLPSHSSLYSFYLLPHSDGFNPLLLTMALPGGGICGSFLFFGILSVVCYKPWRRYVERKRPALRTNSHVSLRESVAENSMIGEVEIELGSVEGRGQKSKEGAECVEEIELVGSSGVEGERREDNRMNGEKSNVRAQLDDTNIEKLA